MSQRVGAGAAVKKRLTPKQVLDALRDIAALEHAHCVHHLRLHAALGGDPPDGRDDVAPAVREAAAAAYFIAQGDMFHLKDVNRVLVRGGREPVLDRAVQVTPSSGRPIDLGPLTPAQFVTFPKREKAFATALDARYSRLRDALASSTPPALPPDVRDELEGLIQTASGQGMDHVSRLPTLVEPLAGLSPSEYLQVTGVEPTDELDRRLLALSDEFYGSLLAILREHLADVDGAGPPLRQQAVSRMQDLHKITGLLVLRGLLPPFTLF